MNTIVRILLALAIATLASAAHAFDPNAPCIYVDNVEWKRWGAAPFGPTADEALADPKLDWYLRCSTVLPEHLKKKVKEAIRAKPQGEQTAYLTPDMTLPEMASGPDTAHPYPHIMRNAKVARIMVAFGIVRAAETRTWSVKDADGTTFMIGDPLKCGNLAVIKVIPPPVMAVAIPVSVARPPAPPAAKALPTETAVPVTATGKCPEIALFANAWEEETIHAASEKLGEKFNALVTAAILRDSENASNAEAYKADDVSRTIGDDLILVVGIRAPIGADILVRLLDPVTLRVVEDLGRFHLVDGIAKIILTEAQRNKLIVETIWPAWFTSPTMSGGLRRLWFFPEEWEKKRKSEGRWCSMEEHGVYKRENKPKE